MPHPDYTNYSLNARNFRDRRVPMAGTDLYWTSPNGHLAPLDFQVCNVVQGLPGRRGNPDIKGRRAALDLRNAIRSSALRACEAVF